MRELSVFCDESGDFGALSNHSPRYIISLVLHDQSHSISDQAGVFQQRLRDRQLEGYVPIHTAPLIRRESPYKGLSGSTRASLFDVLFSFFRHCKVHPKVSYSLEPTLFQLTYAPHDLYAVLNAQYVMV